MKTLLAILFLLLPIISNAQATQEEYNNAISEFYINQNDTEANIEKAKMLFERLENTKELQTYANYLMLSQVFENQAPDEAMAQRCKDRGQEILNALIGTSTTATTTGNDPASEWNNKYYPALFKTTNPNNARDALKFLEKHLALHNFNNFTYVGYAFERNKDFEKASESYARAMKLVKDDKAEYHPYSYHANFLATSGKYLEAEELIRKMERLAEEATGYFKTSYYVDAMNTRMNYYRHIGDYQGMARAGNAMYDYFIENLSQNLPCSPYEMSKYTVSAYANELLNKMDVAQELWTKYDKSHHEWVECYNATYPNNKYNPLSMLPVFNMKRGNFNAVNENKQQHIDEVIDHYKTYEEYKDFSISHYKAVHLAFLGYDQYDALFNPLIKKVVDTKDFTESTTPLSNYAYFTMRDRKLDVAKNTYVQLFKTNLDWLNDLFVTFGEKAFVTYYNNRLKQGYDNYHSLVKLSKEQYPQYYSELTQQAYDNLLLTKSIAFKGSVKRKKAFLESNSKEIRDLYNKWLDKKQQLIFKYQTVQDPNASQAEKNTINEEEIKQLQLEVDQLENELATKAKNFKENLTIKQQSWKAVRNKLKDGEAAVEIIRFLWRDQVFYSDSSYYAAYIIKKDSKHPEVIYLPTLAGELDNRYYNLYKNSVQLKVDDNESYKQFWEPIKQQFQGINKVYFSPDGIYHLINLPSLRNPNSGKFLLDEIELQYVTSTDITTEASMIKPKSSVLIGRPAYDTDSKALATSENADRSFVNNFRDNEVVDLPGTEDEIRTIASAMNSQQVQTEVYVGELATEEIMYNLDNPDILHIATHGYWSGLEEASAEFRTFNAMVNSGLLLSGVVDYYSADELAYTHDGILTAYEAQNLNLENTSLVVLSACETGLGHLDAGEGVYGLQRAFRAAGAASIILSLWKVDDQATKDFMITFYKHYLDSGDKFSAFYTTQSQMKEKYKAPYYWGAFVLVGE